ncbi:MAG: response regulator transcription factor [Burkholderiaceae bacterium]
MKRHHLPHPAASAPGSPATQAMGHVAVLEDDDQLATQLCELLQLQGWQVRRFARGQLLLDALDRQHFDAVLCDLRLPDMTGLDVLAAHRARASQHRAQGPAMIMLTGATDEASLVQAFALGAHDYVHKPFRAAELQARLSASVRRRRAERMEQAQAIGPIGSIRLDPHGENGPQAHRNGQAVALTDKEFQCAQMLLGQLGQTGSRNEIRLQVWRHNEHVQTRTIDTHISRVRQKLGLTPDQGFRLSPVYGIGYRLDHFS